jgi:subtilisin family serine protease
MSRRQRSRGPVRCAHRSQCRGLSPRRILSRRLLLEGLESRLLLTADDLLPGGFPAPDDFLGRPLVEEVAVSDNTLTSGAGSDLDTASSGPSQILVKLRDQAVPDLGASALRGPATALVAASGFYPLSDIVLTVGATSAAPVMSQLARVPLETGRWPALIAEAEPSAESAEAAARQELGRWYRLELPADADVQAALAALEGLSQVEVAEANLAWRLSAEIPPIIEGLPDGTTDPAYDEQWFHDNAKIWKAWDFLNHNGVYPGGSQDIVVAVIDSGVDYLHEDLAANMWVNPDEIAGNGIDDDGNGFVDDIHGVSVVSNPNMHSGDPIDQHGHGTHVAGIIAAQGFNGKGGVGVAFNTRVMAVRAAQYSGVLTMDDIAEGIMYAVENGAEVINMSFGGYTESVLVQDALEVALHQAVLVAAAGNDGADIPMFPGALSYVLSVGASTPADGKASFSNSGYDIMAPGVSIHSTLPGNQYASWSGTSMATPVISGVAALMRSYFWQRDIYSSRFIMGSIAASGNVVDTYVALTEPPQPGVRLYENWLFDDAAIDPGNDGDGRIDAGETVHLAIEVINRAGMAENVTATLTARAAGAVMDDPYVTILSDTVEFGNIGPFALGDNGLVWDETGEIIGVEFPFVVSIDPACPNDHVIPFELTTTFEDGWDEEHRSYMRIDRFRYIVQRGKNVPTVISDDLTLTAEDFWIVGGPVLIEQSGSLTIEPGTYVQWGAISDDPYNPGPQSGYVLVRGTLSIEGSQEQPIHLFPSELVSGQTTKIMIEGSGTANLAYATIRNPELLGGGWNNTHGFGTIDHAYFSWANQTSSITADRISNSIFHKLRGGGNIAVNYDVDTCLFDAGYLVPGNTYAGVKPRLYNNVFLQDNENASPVSLTPALTLDRSHLGVPFHVVAHEGSTYALLNASEVSVEVIDVIASYFGGHPLIVNDADEQARAMAYWQSKPYIGKYAVGIMGMTDEGQPGTYAWVDGSPVDYTNWGTNQPESQAANRRHWVRFRADNVDGGGAWATTVDPAGVWILEFPGDWTEAQIAAPFESGEIWQYVRDQYVGHYERNAFLSQYWNPQLNRWMRITAPPPGTGFVGMQDNYWGTDSTTLIDHAIYDYYDTFTTAIVEYGSPSPYGAESTYPFVQSVSINGVPAQSVPEIGAGPATFEVTFNRPMDPSVQPFVTFGPSPPHTDFSVHPLGGNDAGYNRNTIDFTVSLSLPASQSVTVDYATLDDTAVAGVDYQDTQGTLVFQAGELEKTVSVPLIGNILEEDGRSFFLILSDPTVAVLEDSQAVGTILDDDPSLAIGSVEVLEADSGTTDAVFTVSLSKACDEQATVQYATIVGSAQAGTDYQPVSGMLTFEPGTLEQTISVPVFGNTLHQPDRSFFVELTHPTRVNIAEKRGEGIIIDDDPSMSIGDVAVVEGDAGTTDIVFTVSLSSPPLKTIAVDFATANRTAMADEDYLAQSGTLTFLPGESAEQTIVVPVLGDTAEEPNETFVVNLSNLQGAVLNEAEGIGTIITDDGLLVSVDDVTIVEGDGGRLDWSTFLGGSSEDVGYGIAIDGDGNAWVTGWTSSAGWTAGGFDTSYNGGPDDAFVAKLSPDGQLLWSTYLGGSDSDQGQDIAIDGEGNIWITGISTSPGWISGGFDSTYNGGDDAFVVKLDSSGQILWSSYLGGSGDDDAYAIAVDANGDAWITGRTDSDGWVSGGFNTVYQGGGYDGFVAKLSANGQLLWSTYLGGTYEDYGRDVAVDGDGNGWVVGHTASDGWISGGHSTSRRGPCDGFVANISSAGQLQWSSYLGGSSYDYAFGIAVDPAGGAWIVGETYSTDFPCMDAFTPVHKGHTDGFITRLNAAGQMLFSSYLPGGTSYDRAWKVAIDASGDAWVAGSTHGGNWASGGFDSTDNGSEDGYVLRLAADGSRVLWSSYLGGSAGDVAHDLAIDTDGKVWLLGATMSDHWVSGGTATRLSGPRDAFVARVYDDGVTIAEFTVSLSETPDEAVTVQYATSNATALAGQDYEATSGVLTFSPVGPLEQPVFVRILGDLQAVEDEQFYLDLEFSSDGFITTSRGTATILNDDPLISVDDATIVEGEVGTVDAVFTVTLSVAAARTIQVDYTTQDQTATAGGDYQAVSGTLVFAPGETEKTITVPVYGDLLDEDDETFLVALSSVVDAELLKANGVGTILDDDPTLSVDGVAVIEGDEGTTDVVFTVSLSSQPHQTVTVRYQTVDDTATADEDYLPVTGRLVFEPGHPLVQTVHVPVLGDTPDELDETFFLELFAPTYGTLERALGVGTILDDDPKIWIDDVAVLEGDNGTTQAVFTVSLSAAPARPLVIDYHTTDGTATVGEDYQAASGTLTFEPGGPTEQTISVTVDGDTDGEPNETFYVHLSGAADAKFVSAEAQGTIVSDDGPLLSIDDVQIVEGHSGTTYAQFTVSLSEAITEEVRVDYATVDATAKAGEDYQHVAGTLIFAAGPAGQQTLLVPVLGDRLHEGEETFFVDLTNATLVGISRSRGVGTMVCDDPVLSIDDVSLTEGNSGNPQLEFTVTVSQPLYTPVTVDYATADGTATSGSDYLPTSGTLTFVPGGPFQQQIQVYLIGDTLNEIHETFTVSLSHATGTAAEPFVKLQGVGTILDDDGSKLVIEDASLVEGDEGQADMLFTVRLTEPAAQIISVAYATEDMTARAGLDYLATSGTLEFQVGETEKVISVPVLGDLVDESNEEFRVVLSGDPGIPLLRPEASGTMIDDDTTLISIADATTIEGFSGWVNSRTWQGTFWITPMTGESYHLMRISGAVAADDPWLVSGYDVGRFRFQIKTMGVAAMTLQATGQEGSIRLSWAQDDFELLAGYHLYRAASEAGPYTRVNETIIPITQEWFVDTDVSPAVPMHYKFTVVQTDMTESDPSNVASAAALDTILPVITHTPKTSATPGAGLRLNATVTDNMGVADVAVHYRPLGSSEAYVGLLMANVSATSWSVTIPGSAVQPPGIEYYLTASDGLNTVYHGTPAAPHSVLVTAAPNVTSVSPGQGGFAGGTRVTLTGAMFQDEAMVQFGGLPATDVVVQTSGQILCTTPPHAPSLVDVRVVNPDNTEATLLNGFRYVDDDAVLSLPTMSADHGEFVDIPISLAQVNGLLAAELTVSFDPAVLQVLAVGTGTLTSGWTVVSNTQTAGQIVLSMAGAYASSGEGTLAKLHVEVIGAIASQTTLLLSDVLLNDGAIQANLSNGAFAVHGFFTLGGSIQYFQDNRPVSNTSLELVGVGAQSASSDAGGAFSFATVQTGAYTLTPNKEDQITDITAYDASLILQASAGSITLTTNQRLAADVNASGTVSAMDASLILQRAVGLLSGYFPGAGRSWLFSPAERTYPLLNGNLAGQDFTAILIGDVSGDWDGVGDEGGEPESDAGRVTLGGTSVALTLPDVIWPGDGTVEVPLQIARGAADVYSLDLRLTYDASRLTLLDVTPGDPAEGAMLFANTSQPGLVRIALASGSPLSRDGDLLTLSFQVTDSLATPAALSWQRASVDEGAVVAVVDSGYVADPTPPTVGVEPQWTNNTSPPLSGTVDDTLAAVSVTVAGTTYAADNRGDGTWFLAANTILPSLADGAYDVQVQAWDVLSRSGVDATLDELTIDTLPPLRSSLTPTEDTRGVPFEPELQIEFGELIQKGAGTIVLKLAADGSPVETIDVASAAVSVSGTTATIQPSSTLLDSTAYRVEVAAGAFTDLAGNEAAAIDGATEWTFTTRGALVVESFQATGTGFVATFTSDLRSDALNLYDQGGVWGPADVRVVGAATGPVRGSLVVGPGLRQVTFVATSGILPPDQYSVTFVSGTDGLHDVNAKLLDGDADGAVGDDFATLLSVGSPAAEAIVVSLPHITRGYGQPVNVPAYELDAGLPLTISTGSNVSQVQFQLKYDPALLEITDFTVNNALAGGDATATLTFPDTGIASLSITAPASFAEQAGPLTIGSFTARVPDDAPYGAKHILDIANLQVFDAATPPAERPSIDRDAIHVAALVGDTSGDGWYNSPDATLTRRVIGQINTGFGAYPLADPVLFADITGNGIIQSNDTTAIRRAIGQIAVPDIPPLPGELSMSAATAGPDPGIASNGLDAEPAGDALPPLGYEDDVNGDSLRTSLDVLLASNQLNAEALSVPEGERSERTPPPSAARRAVELRNVASAGAKTWPFESAEFDLLPLDALLGELANDVASAWSLEGDLDS